MASRLTSQEQEVVFSLAESITGSSQKGRWRKSVLIQNVARRIQATRSGSLTPYLHLAASDKQEYSRLVSALTIHFTSFFREADQFDSMSQELALSRERSEPLRILCAACSTGEEAYSLGVYLENKRLSGSISNYEIVAFDIDPVSVEVAKRGIYHVSSLRDIPVSYRRFVRLGEGRTEGLFTFTKDVRSRTSFLEGDLRNLSEDLAKRKGEAFDVVLCRNVLIYFDEAGVGDVVKILRSALVPGGLLVLGHSEALESHKHALEPRGHCIYRKPQEIHSSAVGEGALGPALVVDDSAVVRRVLSVLLAKAGFEVHAVESAKSASRFLATRSVKLVTLDLNMPELDGATWLRQQRSQGLRVPIVIVSDSAPTEAESVLGALTSGAQDYIEKQALAAMPDTIAERLKAIVLHAKKLGEGRAAMPVAVRSRQRGLKPFRPVVILVGASTGGPEALTALLAVMPRDCPPIVVVQHITPAFAPAFAQRLARVAGLPLGSVKQDGVLEAGHLYMPVADHHLGLRRVGGSLKFDIIHSPPEHSVRPAIDVLFRSAAQARTSVVAILLTGMGKDGALGLLELKHAGALTLAQDEGSCVVYGMPREAVQIGAVVDSGDLKALRQEIDLCLAAKRADG